MDNSNSKFYNAPIFSINDFNEISSMVCKEAVPYAIGLLAETACQIIELKKNDGNNLSFDSDYFTAKIKLEYLLYLKTKYLFENFTNNEKESFDRSYTNDVHRLISLLNKVVFNIYNADFSILAEDKTFITINQSPF